jgi:hypothetical protein
MEITSVVKVQRLTGFPLTSPCGDDLEFDAAFLEFEPDPPERPTCTVLHDVFETVD